MTVVTEVVKMTSFSNKKHTLTPWQQTNSQGSFLQLLRCFLLLFFFSCMSISNSYKLVRNPVHSGKSGIKPFARWVLNLTQSIDNKSKTCTGKNVDIGQTNTASYRIWLLRQLFCQVQLFPANYSCKFKDRLPSEKKTVLTRSTWGRSLQAFCPQASCVSCWWCLSKN